MSVAGREAGSNPYDCLLSLSLHDLCPHQHPRAHKHYPTTQQLPILIAPLHGAVKHKVVTIKPAKFTAS